MYKRICCVVAIATIFSGVLCVEPQGKIGNETSTNSSVVVEVKLPGGNKSVEEPPPSPPPTPTPPAKPPSGREGVTAVTSTQIPSSTKNDSSVVNNVTITTKAPPKISPRKGVTLPETLKEQAPVVVKKPTITENSDDDFVQSDAKTSKNKTSVDQLVLDTNKEHKRAAYLIPIIAVIFSVPLVAVIMSVLYRRGSEWWQHRHYRRMDFLIEGMYNN